jgi:hypothetical protein
MFGISPCMLIWRNGTYWNTYVNTHVWVLQLFYELPAGAKKAPLLLFTARSLRTFLRKKQRAARWREKRITRALPNAHSLRVYLKTTEKVGSSTQPPLIWNFQQTHHSSSRYTATMDNLYYNSVTITTSSCYFVVIAPSSLSSSSSTSSSSFSS